MRNRLWDDHFVGHLLLDTEDNAVVAGDSDTGETGGFCGFEGVLYLVETAFGGEDGDVPVIADVATHFYMVGVKNFRCKMREFWFIKEIGCRNFILRVFYWFVLDCVGKS